jgi:uncharacterized damage-inducible protein DinB
MIRDALVAFARYHAWANDRILALASNVPDDELRAPAALDHGTAFDTLRHLVDVDWSWRKFVIGEDVGDAYVWDLGHPMDDVAAIRAFSLEEDATLQAYVASLDDDALGEELSLDPDSVPRWLILAHLLNHGTQHRTEMARYLTDRGHSPGDLDLLDAFDLPQVGDPRGD